MTIKQQGGIFGRNPTFNDINVDNDISISGDATVTGKLGVGGTNAILGFYAEKDNGSGYVGGFRSTNSSPYLTVQTTGGVTNLQGINSGFTDVAAIGLQPSGGNINVGAGNFVMTSGYGIDFSATSGTGTSELFDDYEEGTWTPALSYDTAGTSSFTYAIQQGYYTKVGRLITVHFKVQLTNFSKGTASGSLNITGLPYTPVGSEALPVGSIVLYDAPFSNTPVIVAIYGTTNLRLLQISNNAAWANIDDPDTNSQYLGSVTYFV
jgi:hypothetical protein